MSASVSDFHKRLRLAVYVSRKHEEYTPLLESVQALSKSMNAEVTVGQGNDKTLSISHKFDIQELDKWPEAFAWYCDTLPRYKDAVMAIIDEQ